MCPTCTPCWVEEMEQQYLNRKETLHGPGRLVVVVPFCGGGILSFLGSSLDPFPPLCLLSHHSAALFSGVICLSFGLVAFVFFLVEIHKLLI